ncbi:hypothetical protein FACS1894202_06370 [Clostridia bacterium]|nr:hypothetical protein FACS1894202_06370 [Clostridia bacterium]
MEVRVTVDVRRKREHDDLGGLVFDEEKIARNLKEARETRVNGDKGCTIEEFDLEMRAAIAEGAAIAKRCAPHGRTI